MARPLLRLGGHTALQHPCVPASSSPLDGKEGGRLHDGELIADHLGMRSSHLFFAFNNAEAMHYIWLQCLFFIWKDGETQGTIWDRGDQDHTAHYLQ